MRRPTSERGAVTAEFAVVLPVALLIVAVALSSLSAQVERMKLVSVAAGLARAVGRLEPEQAALARFKEVLAGREVDFSTPDEFICAEVSSRFELLGLAGLSLRLADRECVRKLGL